MKCLEDVTVEQIDEMSFEELKVLFQKCADEEIEDRLRKQLKTAIEVENGKIIKFPKE